MCSCKLGMGFVTVEEHSVSMYDHLLVCDLVERICEDMKNSRNRTLSEAKVSPETLQVKINVSFCFFTS